MWFLASPILIVLLNTNCEPRCSVTNTKCEPNIICQSLQISRGIVDLQCCNYCHFPIDFSSKFQSSMTIFLHKLMTIEGRVFGQHMNSSIIHDNIRSLIRKKYHPKSYHRDIKYHMTLNIKSSVISIHIEEYDVTWLVQNNNSGKKV